ncbi:MAG: glycine C-acetyltransferase [Bacilli bacterium]|nr:glycine C-acetyltransferase [Bacilli bacterium]
MSKYPFLDEKIDELKKSGVYRTLPINYGPIDHTIDLNHKLVINLSSNNYLGLATHERIKHAAVRAIDQYGVGAGSVRTIVGNQDLLEHLEIILANFKHEEAVTCFQSGFTCNLGVIPALTDKDDLIISDELNHASIIDGIRLSKAERMVYRHSDMNHLEELLLQHRSSYKNVFIITDGVFSMDGDIAQLPEIVKLAKKYQALTYVDDAHGSGVLGESGRGTVDHFHLNGEVDFIVGTLSKAIGVVGGYLASKQIVKDWLLHRARPLLFSTALPPSAIASTIEAVKILSESDAYTKRLWDNSFYFKEGLKNLGFDIGHSETPITPVMIGEEAKTMAFSKALLAEGVFVSAIVFPTVPQGKGRLRCMLSASHTKEDLDRALEAFELVGKQMNIIV